jgi:hypothetical protein
MLLNCRLREFYSWFAREQVRKARFFLARLARQRHHHWLIFGFESAQSFIHLFQSRKFIERYPRVRISPTVVARSTSKRTSRPIPAA